MLSPGKGAILKELYTRDGAGILVSRDVYDGIIQVRVCVRIDRCVCLCVGALMSDIYRLYVCMYVACTLYNLSPTYPYVTLL